MTMPVKEVTPEKEFEHSVQKDIELSKLVCIYNKFESERRTRLKAPKTTKARNFLKKELCDVVRDLYSCKSIKNRIKDKNMRAKLKESVRERGDFLTEIKKKEQNLREISDAIKNEKKKIEMIRAKATTDMQWSLRVREGETTLEKLENKMDTVVKQYGVVMGENDRLRKEVEHMMIERVNFNKLWNSLTGNLNRGKMILTDILQLATVAYDQRDEYVAKLRALRNLAVQDLRRDTEEMKSIQDQLDNNYKLRDFVDSKQTCRNMAQLHAAKTMKYEEYLNVMKETLQQRRDAVEKIKRFFGVNVETNINKFVTKYTTRESENMSYFMYIHDLQDQMEYVGTDLVRYQDEIVERQKARNQFKKQQKLKLQKIKNELKLTIEKANLADEGLTELNETMTTIYNGIHKLFKICKCNRAPFDQLLGETTTVNDYNVVLYLKVLEETITKYIRTVYFNEEMNRKNKVVKRRASVINQSRKFRRTKPIAPISLANPCPLCVEREMVTDVVGALQIVSDKETTRLKLNERLQLPDGLSRIHNVSACNLPQSREIIQKKHQ